jgi:hypothetical protein
MLHHRKQLPLLRRLEERGYVEFRPEGVFVLRDIPMDEYSPELWDEFGVADAIAEEFRTEPPWVPDSPPADWRAN